MKRGSAPHLDLIARSSIYMSHHVHLSGHLLCECRRIQFGIKHWAALSVTLAILIPLDSNFPKLPDTWFPVFAYFAVAIAMVEKV